MESSDEKRQYPEVFDKVAKRADGAAVPLAGLSKFFETTASIVAWQVAVVSPGFLGLLWNARTLAEHSRLPAHVFDVVFLAAELCFLAVIILSVLLHNVLTEKSLTGAIGTIALQGIKSTVDKMALMGVDKDSVESFRSLIEQHDGLQQKLVSQPWYLSPAGKLHGWVTIIGYVLVGIIIAALKLH